MSDDFLKDLQTTPTLTFEPFAEEKKAPAEQKIPEEMQKPAFDESILTPEELKQVEAFSEQIDLNNSQMILFFRDCIKQCAHKRSGRNWTDALQCCDGTKRF